METDEYDEEFEVQCQGIDDRTVEFLTHVLQRNSLLKKLNLTRNDIGARGVKKIFEAFTCNDCACVEEIILDFNQNGHLGDQTGARAIGNFLATNSTLKIISLVSNGINDDGAAAIAEGLKKNSTLKKLILDKNKIDVRGAKAIAEALKVNSTLKTLVLNGIELQDEGAEAFVELLKVNSTLNRLYLGDNHISDEVGKALGDARCVF